MAEGTSLMRRIARPAAPPAPQPADGHSPAAILTVTVEDTDAADPR